MSIVSTIEKLRGMDTEVRALVKRSSELSEWEFGKVIDTIEGLFKRFAPWKVDDLAEVHGIGEIPRSSGWWGYREQLADGVLGVIKEVDFRDGRFVALWMPLGQMRTVWKHALPEGYHCDGCPGCSGCCGCCKKWVVAKFEGPMMQVPEESPGHFSLSEKHLIKVDS